MNFVPEDELVDVYIASDSSDDDDSDSAYSPSIHVEEASHGRPEPRVPAADAHGDDLNVQDAASVAAADVVKSWDCPLDGCGYTSPPGQVWSSSLRNGTRHMSGCVNRRYDFISEEYPDLSHVEKLAMLNEQLALNYLRDARKQWCPGANCHTLLAAWTKRHKTCGWKGRPSDDIPNRRAEVEAEQADMTQAAQRLVVHDPVDLDALELPSLDTVASHAKRICDPCRQPFQAPVGTLWMQALSFTLRLISVHNSASAWSLWFMLATATISTSFLKRGGWPAWQAQAASRLHRWLDGDFANLWREAVEADAEAQRLRQARAVDGAPDAQADEAADSEDAKIRDRVQHLVATGRISDAAIAMLGESTVPITPAVVETLRDKFPPAQDDAQWAAAEPQGAILDVDEAAITQLMTSFKRGTSAGLSGIMAEHITSALRFAQALQQQDLIAHLTAVVKLLINGRVPRSVAAWLVGGRLVPVGVDKLRPIVVSDTLARLTSKFGLTTVQHLLPGIFQGRQGGVGEPGARESTVLQLEGSILQHDRQDWGVLSTDFRNGFNTANRRCIAEEVAQRVPVLSNWFRWSYGAPLELVMINGQRLQATEGTCQGDPASPLWFALNFQPVLDEMVSMMPESGVVRAFIDDGAFAGPIPVLLSLAEHLQTPEVRARGLDLRLDKSHLYAPNVGIISVAELRRVHGIPTDLQVSTDGIIILGCPIGTGAFIAAHLDGIARLAQGYSEKLTRLLAPQVALLLLRMTSGATKVGHILRCLDPDTTASMCASVDAHTRAALVAIMGADDDLTPDQWLQAGLPLSKSGLGLCPTMHIRQAAYIASVSTVATRLGLEQGAAFLRNNDKTTSAIFSYNTLVAPSDKLEEARFCDLTKPALKQSDLTSAVHNQHYDELLTGLAQRPHDLARIKEQTLVGASGWLAPTFERGRPYISSVGFRLLLTRHVGGTFTVEDANAVTCPYSMVHHPHADRRKPCDKMLDPHLHHITDSCSHPLKQRHDTLAACLAQQCRRAGLGYMKEVKCIPGSNSVPADVYLFEGPGGKATAVDVSVATPLQMHPVPGGAVAWREVVKERRYHSEFASVDGKIVFLPFVVSTFGGVGSMAKKLISFIAAKLAQRWLMRPQEARVYVMSRVLSSLMNHTATVLSQAMAHVQAQ